MSSPDCIFLAVLPQLSFPFVLSLLSVFSHPVLSFLSCLFHPGCSWLSYLGFPVPALFPKLFLLRVFVKLSRTFLQFKSKFPQKDSKWNCARFLFRQNKIFFTFYHTIILNKNLISCFAWRNDLKLKLPCCLFCQNRQNYDKTDVRFDSFCVSWNKFFDENWKRLSPICCSKGEMGLISNMLEQKVDGVWYSIHWSRGHLECYSSMEIRKGKPWKNTKRNKRVQTVCDFQYISTCLMTASDPICSYQLGPIKIRHRTKCKGHISYTVN